jgi:hypothetical protein
LFTNFPIRGRRLRKGSLRKEKTMKLEKYDRIEDAEQRAAALLFADRKDKEEVEFTTNTESRDFGDKIDPFRYHIETAKQITDGVAYMIERGIKGGNKHVILFYVSPKDILLYPYRNVERNNFPFLFFLRPNEAICFTRPRVPLSADEAMAVDGAKTLYGFFSSDEYDYAREQIQEVAEGKRELFGVEEEEREDGTIVKTLNTMAELPPAILSEFLNVEIHNKADFDKAVEKLLGRSLTDEEREALVFTFEFYQSGYFLRYCLYRFITNEQYSDLKEALSEYAKFGLPDDWESEDKTSELDIGQTAEEWVISSYFDPITYKYVIKTPTREISKFTGIPLSVFQRYADKQIEREAKYLAYAERKEKEEKK